MVTFTLRQSAPNALQFVLFLVLLSLHLRLPGQTKPALVLQDTRGGDDGQQERSQSNHIAKEPDQPGSC